ncbi:hypothetical protein LU276_04230 [Moraxella haemolytica]|uniref:hypothetical protein n=1 Tax=Moraxella TaxID=475 RepID=UPI0025436A09|nr:hypothetical protein [Moraxella sp. ZY171148]WII96027.1 hypothetical protein LU276_04230 [Moraxella sp. ZY171148]
MKFLITISTDSELISYEAVALGFTLASFDHEVQFYFTGNSHLALNDKQSRIYGMVQSLELYDIAKAWTDFSHDTIFDEMIDGLLLRLDAPPMTTDFDSVLEF